MQVFRYFKPGREEPFGKILSRTFPDSSKWYLQGNFGNSVKRFEKSLVPSKEILRIAGATTAAELLPAEVNRIIRDCDASGGNLFRFFRGLYLGEEESLDRKTRGDAESQF